jgi:CO dehydrogenase/acetyl-CoA synthase epsilon subunit
MFKTIKTASEIQSEKEQQAKDARITQLKQLLTDTDYVGMSDYDQDKADVKAQRQLWRDEIRALKGE